MSGVSNRPRLARFTRKPSPRSDWANSPTTAPMTDRVTPTFSPPNSTGKAAGTSSQRNTCQRLACKERIRSIRSSSTERRPTTVLINTGKKMVKAQTSTFDSSPKRNQTMSNGARATIGTDWLATMYGDRNRSTSGDLARR